MSAKPSLFIGSSIEGLDIAKSLQRNLEFSAEVTIWHQGVFGLSVGTLESLEKKLQVMDFSVLVLTPDDLITSRGETNNSARDNVLLELGMSIGILGKERSFIVFDRSSDIKLPSDMAGITPATYEIHKDGNLLSSLGSASSEIEDALKFQGKRAKPGSIGVVDNDTQFRVVADLLGGTANNFLIQLSENNKYLLREDNHRSARIGSHWYAIDSTSLQSHGRFSVDELCRSLIEADIVKQKLDGKITISDRGREFVIWLIDNDYKAIGFRSSIGGWGESEWISESMQMLNLKETNGFMKSMTKYDK